MIAQRDAGGVTFGSSNNTSATPRSAMNVSLQGARSKSRLDWDAIEERNQRAQVLPRRIFFAVIAAFVVYHAWGHFAS